MKHNNKIKITTNKPRVSARPLWLVGPDVPSAGRASYRHALIIPTCFNPRSLIKTIISFGNTQFCCDCNGWQTARRRVGPITAFVSAIQDRRQQEEGVSGLLRYLYQPFRIDDSLEGVSGLLRHLYQPFRIDDSLEGVSVRIDGAITQSPPILYHNGNVWKTPLS